MLSADDVYRQFQIHLDDLERRGIREETDISYDMETSFDEERGGFFGLTVRRLDDGRLVISLDEFFTRSYSWRDSKFLRFLDSVDITETLRRELREEILADYEEVLEENSGWVYVLSLEQLPLLFEILDCSSIETCEKKLDAIIDNDGLATEFGVSFHQRLYRAGIRPEINERYWDWIVDNMYTEDFLNSLGDWEFDVF